MMAKSNFTSVTGPSVWRGAELEADRSWEYHLDAAQRADLDVALDMVRDRTLVDLTADDFPLPHCAELLAGISDDLRSGRGFALLRGFPVEDYSLEELERLYWGLCSHIGAGMTQNSDGGLIHYVTEGARRPNQGRRGVGFPQKANLHVDLMDVVSLLCVRQAPDEPPSWVASSMTVHNDILDRNPDGLARLYEGFEWDRMDEHGTGETPTSGYKVPVFSAADGVVSCRYNRNWITNAAQRNARPFSAEESALFDLFDEAAHGARLEFQFGAGDIQFCNNFTALHGRAAHQVEPDESRRRMLMRIWLDLSDIRPFADEAIIRHGIGRHGQLGWTTDQLRTAANAIPRPRRADGAPLVG